AGSLSRSLVTTMTGIEPPCPRARARARRADDLTGFVSVSMPVAAGRTRDRACPRREQLFDGPAPGAVRSPRRDPRDHRPAGRLARRAGRLAQQAKAVV